MIVVYTPQDGEPQHYDASSLRVSEAAIVQRTVDMKWQEVLKGLEDDDLEAMRGIVWVIRKRTEPTLRYGDFDPGVLEMTSRMDNKEIERWLTVMLDSIDTDVPRETVEEIVSSRLDEVAVDPEYARGLLAARAGDPKEAAPEADSEPPQEETAADADSSPSLTSSTPETATSDSSPTSSTSLPEMSTA